MNIQPLGTDHDYDLSSLDRELDRTKTHVFLGDNAAFLGPLMCSMEFIWTESVPTAATDGAHIWWNPCWFLDLAPDTRKTVLVHELKHVAYLHGLRRGDRDPKIWNYAGDININNELEREGYSFVGVENCWKDQHFGDMPTEEIYDLLTKNAQSPTCAPWGPGSADGSGTGQDELDGLDLAPLTQQKAQQTINNVVQAVHAAKLSNQAGSIPGQTEYYIRKFLEPVIPWETLLYMWFNDLSDEDYSWARPNRRSQEIYLPSRITNDRLEHLAYYLDVSGSISDHDILRFNSEVKYIKDTFNPSKLTLVQFDTQIQQEKEITEDELFSEVKVVGRGGTCLVPVRQHIIDTKPSAAVIFTDLCVAPMQTGPTCPILWIVTDNPGATVPFGKLINIKD